MSYDLDEIKKNTLAQWDGDDYYVLKYFSKRSGLANQVTNLILRFKENDEAAVTIARQLLVGVFEQMEAMLRDQCVCRYIISIPSSTAGRANVPGERVCKVLAGRFQWLTHIPNALVRVETVQKSAFAPPGQRPDYGDHIRTIQYEGPPVRLQGQSVVMFDDVLTRRETSSACRDILKQATACSRVLGIFLGRTQ